jgi:putative oxidoreductase
MRMTFLSKYREAGLLILRASIGCLFIYLSGPALLGGAAKWAQFGAEFRHLGIHSHLQWWGFASALAQTVGGVLVIVGLFFRIGLLLTLIRLLIHTIAIWRIGSLPAYVSLEMCIILASLLLIGPGRYSVDKN